MKKFGWPMSAILIALSAVGLLAQQPKSKPTPITDVSIEHTACFGTCPVYKIILHQDNTATFIGQKYTDRIGTYKANVGPFVRLSKSVQDHGFFGLSEHYSSGVTDQAHVITTVSQGGRLKTVENEGNAGPQGLWELQAIIDGAAAQAHWMKISDSTTYPKTH